MSDDSATYSIVLCQLSHIHVEISLFMVNSCTLQKCLAIFMAIVQGGCSCISIIIFNVQQKKLLPKQGKEMLTSDATEHT